MGQPLKKKIKMLKSDKLEKWTRRENVLNVECAGPEYVLGRKSRVPKRQWLSVY